MKCFFGFHDLARDIVNGKKFWYEGDREVIQWQCWRCAFHFREYRRIKEPVYGPFQVWIGDGWHRPTGVLF